MVDAPAATLAQARAQGDERERTLDGERESLVRHQRERDDADLRTASLVDGDADRAAELLERIGAAQKRIKEIDGELAAVRDASIDEADFDALWDCLAPREQTRVIELLVERVAFDGDGGNISITFRLSGIKRKVEAA